MVYYTVMVPILKVHLFSIHRFIFKPVTVKYRQGP